MIPYRSAKVCSTLSLVVGLAACSPYAYKEETASFSSGVETSVESFAALKPQYTAWATEQRDAQLLAAFAATAMKPSTSEACEELRARYDAAFAQTGAPADDLLSAEDYAACHATPQPRTDPEAGLPDVEALGKALKGYAAGLAAVTNAGHEAALEEAFGKFNTSAKRLLGTVNEELAKKHEPAFDAVGALVYEAGLGYLRQRRFDALRQGVNDNHEVVARAADLLAEAAFDIYGPTLSAKKAALEQAENAAVTADAGSFVAVWSDIDAARDAYVRAFQDSPIYAFVKIKSTHAALRDSVNDPANRAQLEAFYANVVALTKAADAALEAVRTDDGEGS